MTPLQALFAVLREEGVTRIFGNPGTTELPLLDALTELPEFEYTLGLQEGSVMAMADGYARATGRTAFVNLHVAAGLANGMVGMLNAARSRTPLVVTAGQQDRRHLAQDPMLAGDLVGIARPVAKQVFDVQHAYDLPLLLRRAFALAARPPAGPVFLSLPMDLMAELTEVSLPSRSVVAPAGPAPGLADAARLLAAARSPVIVAGDGVGRDAAVPALVAVAEALGATVYHQPMNDGVDFPGSHPLHAGTLPARHAGIRAALTGHDVVLIAGCHAFTPHHYTPEHPLPDGITVVQLDSDPAEIGRNFGADRGLVGGIRASLQGLAALLTGTADGSAERLAAGRLAAERRDAELARQLGGLRAVAPIDPLAAAAAVAAGLPDNAVLVEEAITTGVLLRRVLRLDRPGSYVHTVGGGLGSGIGSAVGHRLGDPRRPVVAVLGDGCTMFGLQGLWSAVRYRVPVTFVVMNNGEYRTLKHTLDDIDGPSARQRRYLGLDLGPPALDFTRAAAFFGMDAIRVRDTNELTETLAKAGTRDAPLLIDVPITGHRHPEEDA
ncbi:thiamine pyrophosphate-binding protein [Micromonospora sp. NPDC049175]|uniref:thiamine pyrophosphate-binding protein n=1 Tax=Micromonospora sp. NPDC049175 TaxID=3364266 RepID=UPI00371E64C4